LYFIGRSLECLLMLLSITLRLVLPSSSCIDLAPVGEMSRDMAKEGLKLCEGYRMSENFGNDGGRVRKRKGN
jgi:hypothetical protein